MKPEYISNSSELSAGVKYWMEMYEIINNIKDNDRGAT